MPIYNVDVEVYLNGIRIEAENEADARAQIEYAINSWLDDYVPLDPEGAEVTAMYPDEVSE